MKNGFPKNWKFVAIGDCVEEMRGGAPLKPADFTDEGFPILHKGTIRRGGQLVFDRNGKSHTTNEYADAKQASIINAEFVAVTLRDLVPTGPTIGLAANVRGDDHYLLAQGAYGLRLKEDYLHRDFFIQLTNSPWYRAAIKRRMVGSTQVHVRNTDYKEFRIPLPSLSEQKRIAGILDMADSIRRKRQQAIGLTEQFLRSTFLDMFGDPVTNPKGWPVEELKKLVSRGFQNGAYYPKGKYTDDESGVEMVHMSDAFYGTVSFDEIKRVSAPADDTVKYGLDENDVLVARRSLNYEGSAKPCRIPQIGRDLIFESSLIRVTPDRAKLHPLYFYYFLSNPRARNKYVFRHVTRSTISGINQSGLGRVGIVLPPIEQQERFVAFHEHFDRSVERLATNSEVLDDLFNSLVQRAFKGEL